MELFELLLILVVRIVFMPKGKKLMINNQRFNKLIYKLKIL